MNVALQNIQACIWNAISVSGHHTDIVTNLETIRMNVEWMVGNSDCTLAAKDEHIKKVIAAKDEEIEQLEVLATVNDPHIVALKAVVVAKDAHIDKLNAVIAAKNSQIVFLEGQRARMTAEIAELDQDQTSMIEIMAEKCFEMQDKDALISELSEKLAVNDLATQRLFEKNKELQVKDALIADRDQKITSLTDDNAALTAELRAAHTLDGF